MPGVPGRASPNASTIILDVGPANDDPARFRPAVIVDRDLDLNAGIDTGVDLSL